MLVGPDGQSFGLVSGGCLEADIRLNARKVLAFDQPKCILYDSTEEGAENENVAAELGLGCNGRVEILIQPLKSEQRDVLLQLLERMESGRDSFILQCFQSDNSEDLQALVLLDESLEVINNTSLASLPTLDSSNLSKHQILVAGDQRWSLNRQDHAIRLWIFGGGEDARPMVSLAASLGWKVTLLDHRPAYARREDFPLVANIIRQRPDELDQTVDADAAIVMTHNIELDAAWLARISPAESLRYIGLLGPFERKQDVMERAKIGSNSDIHKLLHGPMGFDIGGDIPETVALSTLAQCHQILFREEPSRRDNG